MQLTKKYLLSVGYNFYRVRKYQAFFLLLYKGFIYEKGGLVEKN